MEDTVDKISEDAREALQARVAGLVPTMTDVKVEPWKNHEDKVDGLSVHPVYAGVDRTEGSGWVVKDRTMADRLTRALRAGVAAPNPTVKVDVYGQTYVSAEHAVMGRRMNADLRRLGF